MLLVASFVLILPIQSDTKNLKNYLNSGVWVLIWKYSARAFQWIPTWQGSNAFQNSLRPCALDESSLSPRAYSNWSLTSYRFFYSSKTQSSHLTFNIDLISPNCVISQLSCLVIPDQPMMASSKMSHLGTGLFYFTQMVVSSFHSKISKVWIWLPLSHNYLYEFWIFSLP